MCKHFMKMDPIVKFTFSKKATKIDKIFTVNLTVCSNHQIDGEDLVHFCGLLRKRELYYFRNPSRRFFFFRRCNGACQILKLWCETNNSEFLSWNFTAITVYSAYFFRTLCVCLLFDESEGRS